MLSCWAVLLCLVVIFTAGTEDVSDMQLQAFDGADDASQVDLYDSLGKGGEASSEADNEFSGIDRSKALEKADASVRQAEKGDAVGPRSPKAEGKPTSSAKTKGGGNRTEGTNQALLDARSVPTKLKETTASPPKRAKGGHRTCACAPEDWWGWRMTNVPRQPWKSKSSGISSSAASAGRSKQPNDTYKPETDREQQQTKNDKANATWISSASNTTNAGSTKLKLGEASGRRGKASTIRRGGGVRYRSAMTFRFSRRWFMGNFEEANEEEQGEWSEELGETNTGASGSKKKKNSKKVTVCVQDQSWEYRGEIRTDKGMCLTARDAGTRVTPCADPPTLEQIWKFSITSSRITTAGEEALCLMVPVPLLPPPAPLPAESAESASVEGGETSPQKLAVDGSAGRSRFNELKRTSNATSGRKLLSVPVADPSQLLIVKCESGNSRQRFDYTNGILSSSAHRWKKQWSFSSGNGGPAPKSNEPTATGTDGFPGSGNATKGIDKCDRWGYRWYDTGKKTSHAWIEGNWSHPIPIGFAGNSMATAKYQVSPPGCPEKCNPKQDEWMASLTVLKDASCPVMDVAPNVTISAGKQHVCAIAQSGKAICWGSNKYNKAQGGAPKAALFTSVSAGNDHTCALHRVSAEVSCWGEADVTAQTPKETPMTQVAASGEYSCGILEGSEGNLDLEGSVKCWGYGNATSPTGSTTFKQIAVKEGSFCGVTTAKNGSNVLCYIGKHIASAKPQTSREIRLVGGSSMSKSESRLDEATVLLDEGSELRIQNTRVQLRGRQSTRRRRHQHARPCRRRSQCAGTGCSYDSNTRRRMYQMKRACQTNIAKVRAIAARARAIAAIKLGMGKSGCPGIKQRSAETRFGKLPVRRSQRVPKDFFTSVSTSELVACGIINATKAIKCWSHNPHYKKGEKKPKMKEATLSPMLSAEERVKIEGQRKKAKAREINIKRATKRAMEEGDVRNGLILDLVGGDYIKMLAITSKHKHIWNSRTPEDGDKLYGRVPQQLQYNRGEGGFHFRKLSSLFRRDVITVSLQTSAKKYPAMTYEMWVKPIKVVNKDWVMAQYPNSNTTRALTLNDQGRGYVGIVGGRQEKTSGLGRLPIGEWAHVVGIWHQNGTSYAYLNGRKSAPYHKTFNSEFEARMPMLVIGKHILVSCCSQLHNDLIRSNNDFYI